MGNRIHCPEIQVYAFSIELDILLLIILYFINQARKNVGPKTPIPMPMLAIKRGYITRRTKPNHKRQASAKMHHLLHPHLYLQKPLFANHPLTPQFTKDKRENYDARLPQNEHALLKRQWDFPDSENGTNGILDHKPDGE